MIACPGHQKGGKTEGGWDDFRAKFVLPLKIVATLFYVTLKVKTIHFLLFHSIPFRKGDLNNPSIKQKRKSNKLRPESAEENRGKPVSPRVLTAVSQRIKLRIDEN